MSMNIFERLSERNKHLDYLKEFDKEVENNSDRGLVLICGSIIDQLLNDLLKSFFIKKDDIDNNLFKNGQALGTFDGKVKAAFYLGLITKVERSNITYIQRIRNRFAHEIIDISFTNNDIKNVCSCFIIPKNSYIPATIPLQKKETDDLPCIDLNPIKKETSAKNRFILTFRYLYMNLMNRTYVEDIGNREEYIKVDTADKTSVAMTNKVKELIEELKESIEKVNDLHIKEEDLLKKQEGINEEDKINLENNKILREEQYALEIKKIEDMEKDYAPLFRIGEYTHAVIKNSLEE